MDKKESKQASRRINKALPSFLPSYSYNTAIPHSHPPPPHPISQLTTSHQHPPKNQPHPQVWGIPEGGLKQNVAEPLVDLRGHERKVTLLRFHPTASHLLASASADNTVKLWDVEKGKEAGSTALVHEQLIQDVQWDYAGSVFATTSKDKALRVVDPRMGGAGAAAAVVKAEAHEGAKSAKCTFLGPRGLLLTVGFTKQSRRQVKVGGKGWGGGACQAASQAAAKRVVTPRSITSRHLTSPHLIPRARISSHHITSHPSLTHSNQQTNRCGTRRRWTGSSRPSTSTRPPVSSW
jgi:hypothetical protein